MKTTGHAMRRMAVGLLGLLVVVAAAAAQADDSPRSLTILHTNDLHARLLPDRRGRGGFAHLATAIRRERAKSESALVLDAGDLVTGTPVSTIFRGVPIYELANLLGIDVSTVGNHEFDYGWERIESFRQEAAFTIVSANVVDGRGRLVADAPWVIREAGGIRVGIVGAATTKLPYLVMHKNLGPWTVQPVVETVRRRVLELAGKVDLIIVVGHLSEREEDELLADVPEVAVVVSGHRHAGLEKPKRDGERVVVRVRAYGLELGRLDLDFDVESGTVVASRWTRIPIDAETTPPAEDVARRVAYWESRVTDVVDVPIGECRGGRSRQQLRSMVERVMVERTGADLAYLGEGAIRDTLPKGRLLARDVWNIMPFNDVIVVLEIKGSELPGSVIPERSVDPERIYTVATTDFDAEIHLEHEAGEAPPTAAAPLLRDVIIDWIREEQVLD